MAGPASRKELSHDRIVEAAARAIRREGYAGVGVADVMKEAGLTHGGFYAHFPSRDAMLVAAMERAGRDGAARMAQGMARRRAEGASRCAPWSRAICQRATWSVAKGLPDFGAGLGDAAPVARGGTSRPAG
ncbi:helix-turn-helix domain-containing protein [Achromobacter xylosoxidans]